MEVRMRYCIFLLLIFISPPFLHAEVHIPPLYNGEIIIQGPLKIDVEVEIFLKATCFLDEIPTNIQVNFPSGIEVIEGNPFWQGNIYLGDTVFIPLKIKIKKPGCYNVYSQMWSQNPICGYKNLKMKSVKSKM